MENPPYVTDPVAPLDLKPEELAAAKEVRAKWGKKGRRMIDPFVKLAAAILGPMRTAYAEVAAQLQATQAARKQATEALKNLRYRTDKLRPMLQQIANDDRWAQRDDAALSLEILCDAIGEDHDDFYETCFRSVGVPGLLWKIREGVCPLCEGRQETCA